MKRTPKIFIAKGTQARRLANDAVRAVRRAEGRWLTARGVIRTAGIKLARQGATNAALAIHRAVGLVLPS